MQHLIPFPYKPEHDVPHFSLYKLGCCCKHRPEKCQPAQDGKIDNIECHCFGMAFLHTPPTLGCPMQTDRILIPKQSCIKSILWDGHHKTVLMQPSCCTLSHIPQQIMQLVLYLQNILKWQFMRTHKNCFLLLQFHKLEVVNSAQWMFVWFLLPYGLF